jgi:hypothetical protein
LNIVDLPFKDNRKVPQPFKYALWVVVGYRVCLGVVEDASYNLGVLVARGEEQCCGYE